MKDTLFLPKTPVPLKAGSNNFLDTYQNDSSCPEFILHDGPPYANGHTHIGHALNKILKDIILRDKRRQGYSASFTPSWDCHGLPIESKLKSRISDFDNTSDFLHALEQYANEWVKVQDQEFKSLKVSYSDDKIKTCDEKNQKTIMKQFHDILLQGKVYQKYKPVYWSPVEQTVMADAEADDVTKTVNQIVCLFPTTSEYHIAVWTTTPWSLVGNAGLAYNEEIEYGVYQVKDKLVICSNDQSHMIPNSIFVKNMRLDELSNLKPLHPFHEDGYPLMDGDCVFVNHTFVKNNVGTGFVHLGPSHSQDDFMVWEEYFPSREFPNPVNQHGKYDNVPLFGEEYVVKKGEFGEASDSVIKKLDEYGLLISSNSQELTVKKSWRSNGLLVIRATSQWFIDIKSAKDKALEMVDNDQIKFIPERSKNRFRSMLETRPDWLVSRQRLWGVPLGIFQNKITKLPLLDSNLCEIVHNNGIYKWHSLSIEEYFSLAGRTDHDEYEKVNGVLDVWFDSSCIQDMNNNKNADLYVEGSDQHRGWFSSSLLKGILTDNIPFKTVLTHGFVVDDSNFKMSKSGKNGMSPKDILKKYNSDVLRLWVASVDYTNDISMRDDVLKNVSSLYDKIRNPFRYMTGILLNHPVNDKVTTTDIHSSIIEEFNEMKNEFNSSMNNYDISKSVKLLREFLEYLSSTYFDIHKDLLYCQKGDDEWNSYRSVIMFLYSELTKLVKPILPSLVNELYEIVKPMDVEIKVVSAPWVKSFLLETKKKIKEMTSDKTDTLVLEMVVDYSISEDKLKRWFMVADVIKSDKWGLSNTVKHKCSRCWRYDSITDEICDRCKNVIGDYYEA